MAAVSDERHEQHTQHEQPERPEQQRWREEHEGHGAPRIVPRLAERQHGFARALLDPQRSIPPGLVGPDGEPSERRFAVYRNNVVSGLIDTLQAAFPAVCRIVGAEFFRAMARVYVAQEPPDSPILLGYGAGFADFIGTFEPAATLAYLPDVARIEHAWAGAYHAADVSPIEAAAMAQIPPDALPGVQLCLGPSVRLIRSRFPALTIWRMNVGDGAPGPVDFDAGGENVLVARPGTQVELRLLSQASTEFIQSLVDGWPVIEAAKVALAVDCRFDLSLDLAELLQSGIVVGFQSPRDARGQLQGSRA
ncbi:MAG: DNA-binding domain-containing protein [Betaproteobacteria bacterium]